MNYKRIRYFFLYLMVTISTGFHQVSAQKTAIIADPEIHFKTGMELFNKEKYSAARREFEKAIENNKPVSQTSLENAWFYRAVCAAELYHTDAEALLLAYVNKFPEALRLRHAYFHLGRLYYKQKRYKNATDAFEKTDIYFLRNDEITEYYFKSGYGYFIKGDMVRAEKSFHQVINVDSRYKAAANYYYAHIAYANNNYTTALSSFNKLDESEAFGPVVPLYIAQIYFDQEKYDELISFAVPQLEKPKLQHAAEIKRLVAESYFRKSDYSKALSCFNDYQKSVPKMQRDEFYQRGFCYYQLKEYPNAISDFQKVAEGSDQLAQHAYFHLADCYLKSNNRQAARNSFQQASGFSFDAHITEESLFSYAKLSYELSFQPVAIKAFRDFISRYPSSSRKDEANQILAEVYLTTHNYKDALVALEGIEKKTDQSKKAFQKVAYYRGSEYFNDGDRVRAISLFDKAIVNNSSPGISALAMYWKAEALYLNQQYEPAIKEYRIFLFAPGSTSLPNFHTVHYNIGYCYFKLENYGEAQIWFRKYLKNKAETDQERYNDALIRVADANFMLKEYDIAIDFYKEAVAGKARGADYCLFQQGMIMGIRGDLSGKAVAMQSVINNFKKSPYLDDAIFERGKALMASGRNNEALVYFQKIAEEYPNSSYNRKALINIGLVYYNEKDDEKALNAFKQVIQKYPSTPEATEALNGVKNIYVNSGNPGGYFDYVKTVPSASISSGAQDSITYEAAEQGYMKGSAGAAKDFENYLKQFPDGYFAVNASFYKAETDFKNKNLQDALAGYEFVISKNRNIFTERSLLKAAFINYKNNNFEKSAEQYGRLEEVAEFPENMLAARAGSMRSHYKLKNCRQAGLSAQKIIDSGKVPGDLLSESHLIAGKCALEEADYTVAQKELALAAKVTNSEIGAESKYNLAYIQFLLTNYKESQKLAFDVIHQVPSYDFWIAKSFILLADNYAALKDNFQAKSTLKSLLENYERNPGDPEDIKAIAGEKLSLILSAENAEVTKEIKENQGILPVEKDSIENEAEQD